MFQLRCLLASVSQRETFQSERKLLTREATYGISQLWANVLALQTHPAHTLVTKWGGESTPPFKAVTCEHLIKNKPHQGQQGVTTQQMQRVWLL